MIPGDQQQFFSGQSYPQQPGYNVGFAPQPAVAPGFHPSAFAPSPEAAGYVPYDAESATVKGFDFSDQSIRRGFIKKVYSILTVRTAGSMHL
ncbi:AGAP005528-PB-like protein [Anopheles sinensis]|uniref:AGAP005528-PB-like protein n=1 Tax=Anopheles sinensis TaxID=74873 RepID=A0A084VZ83_ANOSI|nr:AGAP005528-PB-like protein [Anopheles sinensis]